MAHILVIDDDSAVRHIIVAILQRQGHDVIAAHDVDAALTELETYTPDVVCCDLMMPRKSGLDFLAMKQDMPAIKDVPVIVISASAERNMIDRAVELGAYAHLTKPIGMPMLLKTVQEAVDEGRNG